MASFLDRNKDGKITKEGNLKKNQNNNYLHVLIQFILPIFTKTSMQF